MNFDPFLLSCTFCPAGQEQLTVSFPLFCSTTVGVGVGRAIGGASVTTCLGHYRRKRHKAEVGHGCLTLSVNKAHWKCESWTQRAIKGTVPPSARQNKTCGKFSAVQKVLKHVVLIFIWSVYVCVCACACERVWEIERERERERMSNER